MLMNDVVNHNHVLNIEASIVQHHKLCNCLVKLARDYGFHEFDCRYLSFLS